MTRSPRSLTTSTTCARLGWAPTSWRVSRVRTAAAAWRWTRPPAITTTAWTVGAARWPTSRHGWPREVHVRGVRAPPRAAARAGGGPPRALGGTGSARARGGADHGRSGRLRGPEGGPEDGGPGPVRVPALALPARLRGAGGAQALADPVGGVRPRPSGRGAQPVQPHPRGRAQGRAGGVGEACGGRAPRLPLRPAGPPARRGPRRRGVPTVPRPPPGRDGNGGRRAARRPRDRLSARVVQPAHGRSAPTLGGRLRPGGRGRPHADAGTGGAAATRGVRPAA